MYMVSTGQRVAEIEGLSTQGSVATDGGVITGFANAATYRGVHEDNPIASFGFSSLVLGANDNDYVNAYARNLFGEKFGVVRSPWQTGAGSTADINLAQKPNFLKTGEELKLIAINRATGYIGTTKTRITGLNAKNPIDIILAPPNLKVIATRDLDDKQGANKDTRQGHHYNVIGSEGAGLTSDNYIAIKTIWLDHDGTPLPDDLPGYTGRVAVSTGSSTTDYSGKIGRASWRERV